MLTPLMLPPPLQQYPRPPNYTYQSSQAVERIRHLEQRGINSFTHFGNKLGYKDRIGGLNFKITYFRVTVRDHVKSIE